ncbi:LAMP1 [Branchiostoma lanceolatum]|uniref:Lysosome-associated membrane glycoprotein 5 n=1 Tax=Branchiostoma lanceolatum TaxID=7740 RepID=A0A8K0F1L0_BRALA|nr:LAMP1 [Branchiostoma lanceolatum]
MWNVTNENGTICILAYMAVSMEITYTTEANTSAIASGYCSELGSEITLSFDNDRFSLTLLFEGQLSPDDTSFELSKITLNYLETLEIFPDSAMPHVTHHVVDGNLSPHTLSAEFGKSYKCNSGQEIVLDYEGRDHVLMISTIQVQPFEVHDDKFSDANLCPAETTTAQSTKVSTPTTEGKTEIPYVPPTGPPIEGEWYVLKAGKKCFILKSALQFNISYVSSPNFYSAWRLVNVPDTAIASGYCSELGSEITLSFDNDRFSLTLLFEGQLSPEDTSFELSKITLNYLETLEIFPDSAMPNVPHHVVDGNLSPHTLSAEFGKSYKCNSGQGIVLDYEGRDHVLMISTIQVQPFEVHDDKFSDAYQCPGHSPPKVNSSNPVVIAVVVVSVGLILVAIPVVYICRKKRLCRGLAKHVQAMPTQGPAGFTALVNPPGDARPLVSMVEDD